MDKYITISEGYNQQHFEKIHFLINVLSKYKILNILEIGFKEDYSSEIFLKYNKNIKVTSFNKYAKKNIIDVTFPGRHTLITDLSSIENKTFDLIFNCSDTNYKRFAHKNTIVIMDDTVYTPGQETDQTKLWLENKSIRKISNQDFSINSGVSLGKFIKPAIVCIAKLESDYIIDFVRYHLLLGFDKIFVYDNEDTPVYEQLLLEFSKNVTVIHLPGNNYSEAVQYYALRHFEKNYMDKFTHVAHIDIDEYIVLKKHSTILEFISEYFIKNCGAIGINWRFFGSNGHTEKTNIPVMERFTRCELKGNRHIKTLFETSAFIIYKNNPHAVVLQPGYYTKSTNGYIINGPFNENIDFSVIQLNHYKCKTLPEFKYARSRGRADLKNNPKEDIEASFKLFDLNEIEFTR